MHRLYQLILVFSCILIACSKSDPPGESDEWARSVLKASGLPAKCAACLVAEADKFVSDQINAISSYKIPDSEPTLCGNSCQEDANISAEEDAGHEVSVSRHLVSGHFSYGVVREVMEKLLFVKFHLKDESSAKRDFFERKARANFDVATDNFSSFNVLYDSVCSIETSSGKGSAVLATINPVCALYGGKYCLTNSDAGIFLITARHVLEGAKNINQINCGGRRISFLRNENSPIFNVTYHSSAETDLAIVGNIAVGSGLPALVEPGFLSNFSDHFWYSDKLSLVECPVLGGLFGATILDPVSRAKLGAGEDPTGSKASLRAKTQTECFDSAKEFGLRVHVDGNPERSSITFLNTRRPEDLKGSEVVVLGHPLGRSEVLVTKGNIMGGDEMNPSGFLISAPISPGSSGSPVFDRQGRLIGIVVSSYTRGQNINRVEKLTR